jgi:hypothetical protein
MGARKKAEAPASKPQAKTKADVRELGSFWKLPAGAVVRRPNGVVVTTRGGHVLDIPGIYVCGEDSVTAE